MHWELWDTESGTMVGDYPSEDDALTIVRDALHRYGPSVVATLALGAEHDDERETDADLPPVLRDEALAARALDGSSGQVADRL